MPGKDRPIWHRWRNIVGWNQKVCEATRPKPSKSMAVSYKLQFTRFGCVSSILEFSIIYEVKDNGIFAAAHIRNSCHTAKPNGRTAPFLMTCG